MEELMDAMIIAYIKTIWTARYGLIYTKMTMMEMAYHTGWRKMFIIPIPQKMIVEAMQMEMACQ